MALLILLVLSLIWVTWVAGILADHLFSRVGRAAAAPASWTGSLETVEPAEPPGDDAPIIGTIEALDPVSLSLVLHTDDAQLRYVVLPDPAMLTGLAHGDWISLQVDETGRPWLLRKVEPAFADLLGQLAADDSAAGPALAGRVAALSERHGGRGGMERLAT